LLEPLGSRTLAEAYDIFTEQAENLAEGGVDCFYVETMMAVDESEIAIKAAKDHTGLPVIATMTFELGQAGYRTMWGVDVPTAVQRLTDAGADVIGANCGKGVEEMIGIITEMKPLSSRPIIAQANAGLPDWVDGVSVYRETPEIIGPKIEQLLKIGIHIVGGCCGTGPAHIKKIREILDRK
jgi:5-methyltetrahydrofolate--homocysteine methyltransferase